MGCVTKCNKGVRGCAPDTDSPQVRSFKWGGFMNQGVYLRGGERKPTNVRAPKKSPGDDICDIVTAQAQRFVRW